MIDDGLGFGPWTLTLERHLRRLITGVFAASGMDWSFRHKRGLGISRDAAGEPNGDPEA